MQLVPFCTVELQPLFLLVLGQSVTLSKGTLLWFYLLAELSVLIFQTDVCLTYSERPPVVENPQYPQTIYFIASLSLLLETFLNGIFIIIACSYW